MDLQTDDESLPSARNVYIYDSMNLDTLMMGEDFQAFNNFIGLIDPEDNNSDDMNGFADVDTSTNTNDSDAVGGYDLIRGANNFQGVYNVAESSTSLQSSYGSNLSMSSLFDLYSEMSENLPYRRPGDKNNIFLSIFNWTSLFVRIGFLSLALFWGYNKIKQRTLTSKWINIFGIPSACKKLMFS
ncbi:uncharacterized protein LOC119661900 [Teleopsis dalmanni]|uniref:uncharacterized protein LOC119661900 n=1 Tax=Teleopsis dalmanni TaxID=139649 RepID=UPI0018CC9E85|nr:uncharacterized protein LOC119661900 [Teleopsis dalmanni]